MSEEKISKEISTETWRELIRKGKIEEFNKLRQENPDAKIDLSGMHVGGNLSGINLENIDLTAAEFEHCNLSKANLKNAVLIRSSFIAVNLDSADLSSANLLEVYFKSRWHWSTECGKSKLLDKSTLREANLKNADLEKSDLTLVDLSGANLKQANLKGVDFGKANLTRTNLEEADLENANLEDANLEAANLKGANFKKANLLDVNFSRADQEEANFELATRGRKDDIKSAADDLLMKGCGKVVGVVFLGLILLFLIILLTKSC